MAATAPPGFEIVRVLGRGGMGVVYLARQVALNRPVALKMMLDDGTDPAAAIRFLAEAEAVASVRHPNVVQVYDFGSHNGRPYMALEFCTGGSLADRLCGPSRPNPDAAAELVRRVAAGVGAAHALGIVHRDLKPGNVLIDETGNPKVADFGLAKRGRGADLTTTGAILGTPTYMAPEQARGDSKFVGPGSDVWALGVMLYEALTGTVPYPGTNAWEVLRAVAAAAPIPVRRAAPDAPRDLVLVCEKCLRPDPRDRYPSAGDLADDLARFRAGKAVAARPVPGWEKVWMWARRNPVGAAAAATAAGLVVAVVVASLAVARAAKKDAAELLRVKGVEDRAAAFFHRAEERAAEAARPGRDDRQADKDWGAVEQDASAAGELLAGEPSLARFPLGPPARELAARARERTAEVRERMAQAGRRADAAARYARLADRHADAVFAGAGLPGVESKDGPASARAAVAAGLAEFGVTAGGDGPPAVDARFHTPGEREDIIGRCVELLLLDARVLLGDPAGGDAAPRAKEALARLDRAERLGAGGPSPYLLRARAEALELLGDRAGADRVRPPSDAQPAGPADLFFAALDSARRGQAAAALNWSNALLRAHPDRPGAEYLLAYCRLLLETPPQPQAAAEGLTRAIDRRPGLPWPRLLRGFASLKLGRWGEARADFDAVLTSGADPVAKYVARVDRGVLGIQLRDWTAAATDLRAAIVARPDAPAAYLSLALVERLRVEVPGWRQEAMALAPGGVVSLAVAEAAQRDARGRAAAVLDEAAARCPPDARVFHERGRLLSQLGDPGRAKADFTRAIEMAAGRTGGTLADDWVELGRLCEADGDAAGAVKAYEAAARADPDLALASRLMARPLMTLGRYREAAAALDRYLAAVPVTPGKAPGPELSATLADALRTKGLALGEAARDRGLLATRNDDLRAAADAYTRGLALVRDPDLLGLRGWAYLALDAPELAAADFEEAVTARPGAGDLVLGRANARARIGQMPGAVADAEAGLERAAAPADPRTLYAAARVHAQAAPWLIRTTGDPAAANRAVRRATGLLGQALRALPPADRRAFWRSTVRADRAFDGIRAGGAMAALGAEYDPPGAAP